MKRTTWSAALTAVILILSACEQERVPQAREENESTRIRDSLTQEEKETFPNVSEKELPPTLPKPMTSQPSQAPAGETSQAAPAVESPGKVTYDASFGRVTFNHEAHAVRLDCAECHATDPPRKIVLDKNKAHEMCKGCHEEKGGGPVQCTGCHQKE